MIEIKIFSDLVDAFEKAIGSMKPIVSYPKEQRDQFRDALSGSFLLINSALNMVIVRLNDVLLEDDDSTFRSDVGKLGSFEEWLKVEREFRLCRSLRRMKSEMRGLGGWVAEKSVDDWDKLIKTIECSIAEEGTVASAIGNALTNLSEMTHTEQPTQDIRGSIKELQSELMKQRADFLQAEVDALDKI